MVDERLSLATEVEDEVVLVPLDGTLCGTEQGLGVEVPCKLSSTEWWYRLLHTARKLVLTGI